MSKKNIRVLIVGSDSSVKGGITTVINSFLNYKWTDIDINVLPTYIEQGSLKKIIFFLKSVIIYIYKLMSNSFDIVHIHMSYKGSFFRKLIIVKLTKLFGKKIVLHMHGSEFEVFYRRSNSIIKGLISNMLTNCDKIIVLGDSWKRVVKKIAPSSSVIVLRNSVSISSYTAKWNEDKVNILFLGVLIKRKGIYDLIEAIRMLNEDGILEKLNLNFIIGGTGEEEQYIKRKLREYKIEKNVSMVGWVDGKMKEDLLKNSQIFILPSYNEGLPMAILEAMSFGIPVISTDVGSISELVINEENGYIIDTKSPEQIVNILKNINKDIWVELSQKSKKCIKNNFNSSVYFEKIIDMYDELIK